MMMNKFAMLHGRTSPLLSRAMQQSRRAYHVVARPAAEAIASETPVLVYDSPEYKQLAQITSSGSSFESQLGSTEHVKKVYSLLPFLVEAAFTDKSFVLRMQLFPKADLLQFDTLQFGGVKTMFVPVKQVIPVTKYDYWCAASVRPFFKQNQCLDLDMIYANANTKEMYVFDKGGEWHDEGVYHEALNTENTYDETRWYDEFNPHNFM